jgi:hypothetical protein
MGLEATGAAGGVGAGVRGAHPVDSGALTDSGASIAERTALAYSARAQLPCPRLG